MHIPDLENDISEIKYFGVGMFKTGTRTLGSCFKILGYKHQSYNIPAFKAYLSNNTDIAYQIINKKETFEDFPWLLMYETLADKYPDSKFILTERKNPKVWFKSFKAHLVELKKHDQFLKMFQLSFKITNWDNFIKDETAIIKVYKIHCQTVKEFFKNQPNRLLVVSWDSGDGWAELCGFLNRPVPDKPFPYIGKTKFISKLKVGLLDWPLISPSNINTRSQIDSMSKYVIYCTPRTGSTYLVQLLMNNDGLKSYGEVFIPKPKNNKGVLKKKEFFYHYARKNLVKRFERFFFKHQVIREFLTSLAQEEKAWGFKMMVSYTSKYPSLISYLKKENFKVIVLKRRNTLKQYLSLLNALNTGVWHQRDLNLKQQAFKLDRHELWLGLNKIKEQNEEIDQWFDGQTTHDIWYEDMIAKPRETVQDLSNFLDVKLSIVEKPSLVKIMPDDLQKIIYNYEEVKGWLMGTEFEYCLNESASG
ncbi:MAG: Stf0 family sulfotransferase [Cyclobacteriaceae bacterium]